MSAVQGNPTSLEVTVNKDTTTTSPQDDGNVCPNQFCCASKPPYFRFRKYCCCNTPLSCCCCCIFSPILALLLFFLLLYISAAAQTFPATEFSNVKYTANGVELHAYLATPKNPLPGSPGVLVFHAWNGMSEEATYFADQLSEQGYYALAPDLFRNVASKGDNIIWNILNVLSTKQERMDVDSDAALAYLTAIKNVDDRKISSGPGFCFGGTQSLIFASRHPTAATVSCYGTYVKELSDPDTKAWGKMEEGGHVLGIYGETDTSPSPKEAEAFGSAMKKKGMPHNITVYPGVGHGFITPEAHKNIDHKDHKQAVDAFTEITQFLNRVFSANATGPSARALDGVSAPHIVPLSVSLYHRMQCAFKCAQDHFTHTGHWQAPRLNMHTNDEDHTLVIEDVA